jgi:two-component system, LuxR family, sensor kinase FixL
MPPFDLWLNKLRELQRYLPKTPREVLICSGILIAVIAYMDWWTGASTYLGFLYVFPMLLVGTVLRRRQIALTAILCTTLAEIFDPFEFTPSNVAGQDALLFIALTGVGFYSREVTVRRRRELDNLQRIEKEMTARCELEEQMEFLIRNSPVAILTMNAKGLIITANSAAHQLFRVDEGELMGRNIARNLPALARIPSIEESDHAFRTEMQGRGKRDNGNIFQADVFFSTYRTVKGPRLAALVVDVSEDMRNRAEYGFEQLMTGSRILVGAVSHEIRNVCVAIAIVYENLARNEDLKKIKDFEALGSLVDALNKIASLDLKQSTGGFEAEIADLTEILEEMHIVLEPYCAESDIMLNWSIPEKLPSVWVDRQSLLQVFLNLFKNSRRVLESTSLKRIEVSVAIGNGIVSVKIADSGPGIASTEKLFQPLQDGAASTGLGLFLSRAFMRTFRGDLRYDFQAPGCCFIIELAIANVAEADRG